MLDREHKHRELTLFLALAFGGVLAALFHVHIPHTNVLIDGRWAFGFMGFALLRRWWAALALAALLSYPFETPHIPLWVGFAANMLHAVPSLLAIRALTGRMLAHWEPGWIFGLGWLALVLLCYQAFVTPAIWAVHALLADQPVVSGVMDGWRMQPFLVESILVALFSAAAMVAFLAVKGLRAQRRRLKHINSVLLGIRNVNQLIVTENDPRRLVEGVCANLTDTMGYHNAWIALLGGEAAHELGLPDTGPVAVAEAAGFDGGFIALRERLDRGAFPDCMSRALNTAKTQVVGDPAADCVDCPLHGEYGGCAGLARRLDFEGLTYGILTASVPAAYARDMEEQELFDEVAKDLAYALHKIAATHRLEHSELRQSLIIEGSGLGTWQWNVQTNETVFNEQWAAMLGYTIEELTPYDLNTWKRLTHPEDLKRANAALADCFEDRTEEYSCELRMKHKDGYWVWILDRGRVMTRDNEGKPVTMFGTHTDITKIKETEETLKREHTMLTRTQAVAHVGSWEWEAENDKVIWSEELFRIFGLEPAKEAPPFAEHQALYVPEDRDRLLQAVEECLRNGVPYTLETRITRPDGESRHCLVRGIPEHDADGKITKLFGSLHDITETKRAEAALREKTDLLQNITDNMFDLVSITDMAGIFVYAGPSHRMLGFEPEEFLGTSVFEYVHPDDVAYIAKEFESFVADPSPDKTRTVEYRQRCKDGTYVWLETVGKILFDDNELPTSLFFSSRNISERKRAEEAMRQRLQYEHLLNEASAMALIADDLGKFQDRCLALVGERLGVDRAYYFKHDEATDTMSNTHEWCAAGVAPQQDKLQGIPVNAFSWWLRKMRRNEILCYPDIEDMPDEATKKMLRSQNIQSIMVVPLFIDGRYEGFLGFDDCARRREWRQEDVDILLSLSRIVAMTTARMQAETRLQNERQQLLSIFNGIEEAIYIADPATYEVLFVNNHLEKMLNENPLGKKCYEQFQGFTAPCEFCTNKIILENSGEVYQWEYYNPNLNRHFLLLDRMIKWTDGRDVRFEMTIDITERKRAEEERERLGAQLAQAQKMESVGRLAGGVAHDFNNMLNVILGHADMALDDLPDESPLRANLDEIRQAAERSAALTRQLLAFARKQTIAPKTLDLNEIVSSMLKMLRRLIGEDIDLLWKPGASLAPIRIDPSQVDQILANLAVNARDAIGHRNGKVTIETANTRFDDDYCANHAGFVPGDYVALTFSDDGCGMDAETRARIFEPFFTTKETGQGTGLGLATIYGIVKQNQGFVNVYSERNEGTTFRLYFPALTESAAHATDTTARREAPDRGNETILVVEDQPSLLELARRMLERLGYTVLTAATPGEALRIARDYDKTINLLITDVVMPEMNGRALAENLQTLFPNLKIVFMSGYTANVIAHLRFGHMSI